MVVRTLLADEGNATERFVPLGVDDQDLGGHEVLADTIYRYPQVVDGKHMVTLTIYLGLGEVGGQLWDQELRVLQSIGHLEHPSLPTLAGGGYLPPERYAPGVLPKPPGAGYVRTYAYGNAIEGGVTMIAEYFRDHRGQALQHFWLLSDGLAQLHDSRIAHRNLWPGTLEYEEVSDVDDEFRIRLARFEMSTMVSNLLRAHRVDSAGAANVRQLYMVQHERFLAYTPPERIAFLFGAKNTVDIGGPAGDVFSLATMVAEWLLGPELLDEVPSNHHDLLDFQREVRRRVRVAPTLPKSLSALLSDMLHPVPRSRPTMVDVMSTMTTYYHDMLEFVAGDQMGAKPYLVAYMRPDSDKTLLQWRALTESAQTRDGEKQLIDLIESDLMSATVCHSPDGAIPFVKTGSRESRGRATTVLFGQNYVWFTETLFRRAGMGRTKYFDEIQVIKYVVENPRIPPRLHQLRKNSLSRRLFAVEAIDYASSVPVIEERAKGRPSWPDLIRTTSRVRARTAAGQRYVDALEWYLEYQGARLSAREYPFVRESEGERTTEAALRWDRDADQARAYSLPVMHTKMLTNERLRVPMGHFFEEAAEEADGVLIEVREDDSGRPGRRVDAYRLLRTQGQETVVLNTTRMRGVPHRGWIRLVDDGPSHSNLRHQAAAVDELADNQLLLSSLTAPAGRVKRPERWALAGGDLKGEGKVAVRSMLEHDVIFALQGPPGTGKTEVTAQAVSEYLAADPRARVLVSAQSHDALDNVAARILQKIDALDGDLSPTASEWLALRVASERRARQVTRSVRPFLEDELVPRLQKEIRRKIDAHVESRRFDDGKLLEILGKWRDAVVTDELELRMRVRRGANIIFATTGAATKNRLVELGSTEPFDWVLVEEAAKAWPTELAMPLVRGLRWTLVGDQAQIGAFARQDVERFLEGCRNDPDEQVAEWWSLRDSFLDAFTTFGHLFDDDRADAPHLRLSEQRRMRKPIAEVVSKGFYTGRAGGGLVTKRPDRDHGLEAPPWLRGRAFVWLDTGSTRQATGYWYNAAEAELVAGLLRSMRRASGRLTPDDSIAILTPYRKQVETISLRVPEFASKTWTVDSFQGREAEIVVASLVRDRDPRNDSPFSALGHLADPARANVLLSRARDLMIVVGRIDLYERCGVPEWEAAVSAAREVGRVVRADTMDIP